MKLNVSGKVSDRLIIININRTYKMTRNLYSATREAWVLNKNRADKADYILCEYQGEIKEIFEFDNSTVGWQPIASPPPTWKRKRFFFDGHVVKDAKVRAKYVGATVTKKKGEANPIHYYNM